MGLAVILQTWQTGFYAESSSRLILVISVNFRLHSVWIKEQMDWQRFSPPVLMRGE